MKSTKNNQNARIEVKDAGLVSRLLTFLFDNFGNFFFGLVDQFFDFGGLDATIGN